MQLGITIEESGEDLYITPVAYNYKDNKILYYRCHEFVPYESQFDDIWAIQANYGSICWNWRMLFSAPLHLAKWTVSDILRVSKSKFLKFYYLYIKKFVVVCREIWEQPCFWQNLKYFLSFWENQHPIQAAEIFEGYFWVNSQLNIKDDNDYSDSYYLIPSQKYLEARVNEFIEEYLKVKDNLEEYHKERQRNVYQSNAGELIAEFKTWQRKMLDKGCKIGYIAELET